MEKLQQLELMDKVQRELEDLQRSLPAVLKKVSQISAHNITLGAGLLDEKLPDLQEKLDASVVTVTDLGEAFADYRGKFFSDNKLASAQDPTA